MLMIRATAVVVTTTPWAFGPGGFFLPIGRASATLWP